MTHVAKMDNITDLTKELDRVLETIKIQEKNIDYKYDEGTSLEQIKKYIDSTYSQHYSTGNIQAAEYIVDQQQSLDYLLGNVIKYASRFGKKEGHNKKDLLKTIHYAIIALYYFEKFYNGEKNESV